MECFGFSCRFKVPNILKHRRGDSELRKQRKSDREMRQHRKDDRELRNGFWRALSQTVETSRIPSLARNFNDWFSKHVPGRQRCDNSVASPRERPQKTEVHDQPVLGIKYQYKVENFATTTGKQHHIPASRKPGVARVKPVTKRGLSVQNMDGDTTQDQGHHTASVGLSYVADGEDRTGRRKTVKKVSKSRKKDITITDGSQYLEAEKLWEDFPFCKGEENVILHIGKPALPPIRPNPSEVVVKKRRRKVKHVFKNAIQEPAESEVTPEHSAVDCTDAVAEERDEPPGSTDLSEVETMEDAIEAFAMAPVLPFASSDPTGDWMGDMSPEGETGEEDEYTDTPDWEVIMSEVSGIKGILLLKENAQMRVKEEVRFLVGEDQQDNLSNFLRRRDDKPSRPLYRPQHKEAWPLQKKNESERRRQLDKTVEKKLRASDTTYHCESETRIRIKGKTKYSKHEAVENTNLSAQEIDDTQDFDVDEAIADILRNMGELP